MKRISVLITDDQVLFAESLQTVLNSRAREIHVVGVVSNGRKAVEFVREHPVDVVLMDVRMPEMDGVEATREILAGHPGIRIVMLTTFRDDDYVYRSLEHGAVGYVLKNTPIEDLIATILAASHGVVQISPDLVPGIVSHYRNDATRTVAQGERPRWLTYLTHREREVLQLMAVGKDNHEIAEQLNLARQTVKNYVSQIYEKLGTKDRMEAVKLVQDLGVDLRLL